MARLLQFPGNLRWILDHCGKTDFCSLPLLLRQVQVTAARGGGVHRPARGHCGNVAVSQMQMQNSFPFTNLRPKYPQIMLLKVECALWQKAAPLANVRENCYDRPGGSFYVSAWEPSLSSAYKADSRYYGKSNKNSWNWRYAAWTAVALPCVRQSEIFLNFALQPTLRPVISTCPPTQPPVSSGLCNWSPPYCFCLAHAKKKGRTERESEGEGDMEREEGWGNL